MLQARAPVHRFQHSLSAGCDREHSGRNAGTTSLVDYSPHYATHDPGITPYYNATITVLVTPAGVEIRPPGGAGSERPAGAERVPGEQLPRVVSVMALSHVHLETFRNSFTASTSLV